ncbi:MAG TPA: outer membrane lipoprotein carrier protein LolA [Desulfobacteraceae bacterium]|nr:outer membrane lipoprotein carrier protein LolA [Desulfobacteraceae bacterium]
MKQRIFTYLITTAVLFVWITLMPGAGFADTVPRTEKIVQELEARYSGADFSANFHQRSLLAAIDVTDKASGRVFFSHPGKMRWEYRHPQANQIITNGTSLWIYRPGENQVVKGKARKFFKAGAGGAFLSDIRLVKKNYTIDLEQEGEDFFQLVLTPREKRNEISSITIEVEKESYEIKTVTTKNSYGDTTELRFSNIRFTPLSSSLFEFTVPPEADLIFMDNTEQEALTGQ